MTTRLVYHGRVQGVGFRWTTHDIAQRHPVTGFVRNQPDGTVELVAQGAPAAIEAFLAEVESAMAGHIDHHEMTDPPGESFETFEIRR
jgi:acylphosphatase